MLEVGSEADTGPLHLRSSLEHIVHSSWFHRARSGSKQSETRSIDKNDTPASSVTSTGHEHEHEQGGGHDIAADSDDEAALPFGLLSAEHDNDELDHHGALEEAVDIGSGTETNYIEEDAPLDNEDVNGAADDNIPPSPSQEQNQWQCESCDPTEPATQFEMASPTKRCPKPEIFYCSVCECYYCDQCWNKLPPHKLRARGKKKHEKETPETHKILAFIKREAPNSKDAHMVNYPTKWFGVSVQHDAGNLNGVHLDITPRFRSLARLTQTQFPALISFIGETSAGKSSLVRVLLKIMEVKSHTSGKDNKAELPVISDFDQPATPTSSDVHLYPDPMTRDGDRPLLYADCEGLNSGDKDPKAVTDVSEQNRLESWMLQQPLRQFRKLKVVGLAREARSRSWIVKELYPRVLFTFSDLVCYVTRNNRTIEAIISRLLQWADCVLESSVNQPLLPFAIIVVNAYEAKNPLNRDDFLEAFLTKFTGLENDSNFARFVSRWTKLGKEVKTLKQLIHYYFSGIKIVLIPHHGIAGLEGPLLIGQYQALYDEICKATDSTKKLRQDGRLLWDWQDLDRYLRYAFNHFSKNPVKPINFLAAPFHHHPVPMGNGITTELLAKRHQIVAIFPIRILSLVLVVFVYLIH